VYDPFFELRTIFSLACGVDRRFQKSFCARVVAGANPFQRALQRRAQAAVLADAAETDK